MKIVKLVLYILFGLMFINAGLNKIFDYLPVPELSEAQMKVMTAFMTITWLMPLVAVIEIAGGILVILRKTRALGAIIILPIMVGILIHHIVLEPSGVLIAVVLFAINLMAIWESREKYEALVK